MERSSANSASRESSSENSAPCMRSTAAMRMNCCFQRSQPGVFRKWCSNRRNLKHLGNSGGPIMKRASQLLLIGIALLAATPLFAQNAVPEIPYDSTPNFLKLPDNLYLGEAVGVATNSKGHVFVYTRTGSPRVTLGTNRVFARSAARLFEFDQTGKYVREIGQGIYGFVFAHAVRVDRQDNIWVIDEGSNMIIKFDPDGRVLMTLGRKPEAINVPASAANEAAPRGGGGGRGGPIGAGIPGDNFNRPTDVAWDSAGNI